MQIVNGTIASAPDGDDRVLVTIDDFDDDQPIGPCPYMPREGAPPSIGDPCLVALAASSSTSLSWVLAYEP